MKPELSMIPVEHLQRTGSCSRFCGRCCSLSHWRAHPLYDTVKDILESAPFTGMKENGDCNHLEWKNGMAVCSIYDTRPDICREFPVHPISIESIPECTIGFRVKD